MRFYRVALVLVVLFMCAGCDQATKSVAKTTLVSAPPISLLNDSVRVQYAENPGAMLGLGAELPGDAKLIFLVVFVGAIVATTLVFALKTRSLSLVQLTGLSILAAGGIGNLLDRIFNNGVVVDFMQLGIGPLKTGIFNVADMLILAGVAILALSSVSVKPDQEVGP